MNLKKDIFIIYLSYSNKPESSQLLWEVKSGSDPFCVGLFTKGQGCMISVSESSGCSYSTSTSFSPLWAVSYISIQSFCHLSYSPPVESTLECSQTFPDLLWPVNNEPVTLESLARSTSLLEFSIWVQLSSSSAELISCLQDFSLSQRNQKHRKEKGLWLRVVTGG